MLSSHHQSLHIIQQNPILSINIVIFLQNQSIEFGGFKKLLYLCDIILKWHKMIAEFTVKNFYSIRSEQKLSFVPSKDTLMEDEYCHQINDNVKLLKIGIIYGANASGKSNVLQALDYFRRLMIHCPNDKSEPLPHEPFLMDDHSTKDHSLMCMSFYQNGIKHSLNVEFDNVRIYCESLMIYNSKQPTLLYSRIYNAETDSTSIKFGNELKMPKADQRTIEGNTINNCSVMAAFGKSNVEATKLNDVYLYFKISMSSVLTPFKSISGYTRDKLKNDKSGILKNFVLQFLQASDFNISDFSIHEQEYILTPDVSRAIGNMPMPKDVHGSILKEGKYKSEEIFFRHKTDEGVFDMDEQLESAGTMRFMGMAVILFELLSKSNFVMIDEVETSIHYELLSYFIKCFLANSENESQLVLTTHDINLLNENFIRRDTIWFTDKDSCGESHIVRLSNLGLHRNLSPYNAYKQGKLVNLPFLESPYINFDFSIADEEK